MPQVAIRWLLQKSFVPSVVIGPRTVDQMEDSMAATTWSLSTEEVSLTNTFINNPKVF